LGTSYSSVKEQIWDHEVFIRVDMFVFLEQYPKFSW